MIHQVTHWPEIAPDDDSRLIGLAVLAKLAFDGADLSPVRARLLDRLTRNERDANALMDLSIVLQLMGHRDYGLALQTYALEIQQVYHLDSAGDARVRLLALLTPGDLAENNALEFLVEGSDIALDLLYVDPRLPLPSPLPEHDLAMVAVCESDRNYPLLEHLGNLVTLWPRPTLCAPDRIAYLSRDGASALLQSIPGLVMPASMRVARRALELIPRVRFPLVARPAGRTRAKGWTVWIVRKRFQAIWHNGPKRSFMLPRTWNIAGRTADSVSIESC